MSVDPGGTGKIPEACLVQLMSTAQPKYQTSKNIVLDVCFLKNEETLINNCQTAFFFPI